MSLVADRKPQEPQNRGAGRDRKQLGPQPLQPQEPRECQGTRELHPQAWRPLPVCRSDVAVT